MSHTTKGNGTFTEAQEQGKNRCIKRLRRRSESSENQRIYFGGAM